MIDLSQTPVKLTPLYNTAQRLGAQFKDLAGWQLPERFTTVEAEVAAARRSVALADGSANGKLRVEGQQAGTVLSAVWDVEPAPAALAVGAGTAVAGDSYLYRLRADLFFVSTPPAVETETVALVSRAAQDAGDLVTVTDLTHGRSELRLVGPASAELLSRLCGLDFHPSAFPDSAAKQSSVAKTSQLIIRRHMGPLPAFSLVGARSLAAYLWDTIVEAGHDLDIVPLGQDALETLLQANEV